MEQRATLIDDGIDRVQDAWNSVEGEFEKLQKNLEKRRRKFEKQAERRVKKFENSRLGKRITTLREDAQKQFESNLESVLGLLPVASAAEVQRLEKRIATLTRKVNALEKSVSA